MTAFSHSGYFNAGNRKLNKTNLALVAVFYRILRTLVAAKSPVSPSMSSHRLIQNVRMKMAGLVNLATNQGKKNCGGYRKEGSRDESRNHRYKKKWGRSGMKLTAKQPLILTRLVKLWWLINFLFCLSFSEINPASLYFKKTCQIRVLGIVQAAHRKMKRTPRFFVTGEKNTKLNQRIRPAKSTCTSVRPRLRAGS